MNLGYSIVGNGWDFGATKDNDGLTISVPVAKNPDGSSITGPSYEYINFDDAKSVRYELTYPAATLDRSKATLTVRARLDDQPTDVPASGWEYVDEKTIRLLPAGTPFKQSHVYEFTYTAKDPVVAALGLAATRDLVSFLRHAAKDDAGNPNPLAGDVRHTFSFSISQPSRTLNDFQALGFNEDERGGASSTACSSGPAAAAAIKSTIGSRRPAEPSATARTTCIPKACSHSRIRC